MRLNFHGNKKTLWQALLSIVLAMTLLSPPAHSHEHMLDAGKPHQLFDLQLATSHNQSDHQHDHKGFGNPANLADYSNHDHSRTRHFHFPENLHSRVLRGVASIGKYKSALFQAVSSRLLQRILHKQSKRLKHKQRLRSRPQSQKR